LTDNKRKEAKVINWDIVKNNRAGTYAHLPEEEKIGTGRTTTMLLDMLDYVKHMKDWAEPGNAIVLIIPSGGMASMFKDNIKRLAKEVDMYITREQKAAIWVNNVPISILGKDSNGWRGHLAVFVDHGVLWRDPEFMITSGLYNIGMRVLRGLRAPSQEKAID